MNIKNLSGDLLGGIIGATVALPQALAFGTMTGVGALSGLYGAMFLCFFAGLFGCNIPLISGPTGPVAIVIASVYASLGGNIQALWAVLFMAGVFQIILSFTRIPDMVKYVPYPVISGFMNGVGVILVILQVGPIFGIDGNSTPVAVFKNIHIILSNINHDALVVGLIALGIIFYTPSNIKKLIPVEILALFAGTYIAYAYSLDVPTVSGLTGSLPFVVKANFSNIIHISTLAFMIAVIASSESLMTGLVIQSLSKKKVNNRLLVFSQGIGNSIASLFGGLSGAAATMRSVAAVKIGAATRISSLICAFVIFVCILKGSTIVNMIPTAVLAAILIKIGLQIIDTKFLKAAKYAPKEDLAVMLLVFFLTIFHDIIFAIGAGITLSAFLFAKKCADKAKLNVVDLEDNEIIKIEKKLHDETHYKIRVVHISGEFFFGSASQIISQFEELLGVKYLIIKYDSDSKLDISAIFALEDILMRLKAQNICVYLVLQSEEILEQFDKLSITEQLNDIEIYYDEVEAIQAAKREFKKTN